MVMLFLLEVVGASQTFANTCISSFETFTAETNFCLGYAPLNCGCSCLLFVAAAAAAASPLLANELNFIIDRLVFWLASR